MEVVTERPWSGASAIVDGRRGDLRRLLWSERTARDLALVLITWTLLLICLAIAQVLNYGLGFAVWPMGEDRVWIDILQNKSLPGAAKAFWQINDRNPLAPWWYIALRPFILRFDAGLLIIREIVGLLLAVTTYIFLFAMTQARMFALSVACVVAVFLANGYIDQIYWTMQIAFIFSLCSLTIYKIFIDTCPSDYKLYSGAIVSWFIAVGTYSIQSGAILAIAFLALIAPAATLTKRFQRAGTDTLPFVLLFVVFWLEWQTTSRTIYLARPRLIAGVTSIFQAFWHFDYLAFFNSVAYVDRGTGVVFLVAASAIGVFVFFAVGRHDQQEILPCPPRRLLEATIVVGCLTLPVAAVEATGYGIIGEAWRKMYQFTVPFTYMSIAAALFALLPAKFVRIAWRIMVAMFAATATAVTLGINHIQVEVTRNEKALRAALIRFSEENANHGHAPPHHFLIRRERGFLWYSSDFLSSIYGRTWTLPPATSFRFFPTAYTSDPKQFLRYTEQGVENAALDGRVISNDNIFLISAGHAGIRRLCRVGPADVAFPFTEWQRTAEWVSTIGDCAVRPQE